MFSQVPRGPPDQIFGIVDRFNTATGKFKENKINKKPISLVVGAYRDENGNPWPLPTIRKIEKAMSEDVKLNHEYLPITGLPVFKSSTQKFLFGLNSDKIATFQCLSGTGALNVGCTFLVSQLKSTKIAFPDPTWPNHLNIARTNNLGIETYPYYNRETNTVKIDEFIDYLKKADTNTVIMLHACAHNPTGMDLTIGDWKRVAAVFSERAKSGKPLVAFFDTAYQGYASGDIDLDASSIRLFYNESLALESCTSAAGAVPIPIVIAQSFSKNMGLYGERVGALHIVCESKDTADRVTSQISAIIRATYSNPPTHGARVASAILNSVGADSYYASWLADLHIMTDRLKLMRLQLREEIEKEQQRVLEAGKGKGEEGKLKLLKGRKWDHVTTQQGMFSYTGLTEKEVMYLENTHYIFMTNDGRISIAGLNADNLKKVAAAFVDAIIHA